MFTKENLAIIALCSQLGYDSDHETFKPYTTKGFFKLYLKFKNAGLGMDILYKESIQSVAETLSLSSDECLKIELLINRTKKLESDLDRFVDRRVFVVTMNDPQYPIKLLKSMKQDAPPLLYYCGDLEILNSKTTGVVGSRVATLQELHFTKKLASALAEKDIAVVSGGARGIDTQAKESALEAGGKIVTYVSDSMMNYSVYNARHIANGKLIALSSIHPNSKFTGYAAMERNQFIYGSCENAVVVSSSDETGGSFKGASICLKQNLCKLYVKDDGYATVGNKKLIQLGGTPLTSIGELL